MAEKKTNVEKSKQDMGTGSVKKLMVQMAVPALVGQVVNLLYNIVDRIYIGHIPEIGGTALTGVGLFSPILMLITAFAMMAGSGGAPRAAIAMGQGDKEKAEKILGNCFTVLMGFAVVLTIVFYIACPTLLRWFGASDATLPYAVEYGRIYILGSICVLTTMGLNVFITTQGFAKISMLTTVIGAVTNIILDPILIFGFDMGVKGAAIATVASQAISALWILRFLTGSKTILKLKPANMKLIPGIILPCLGLGVSTFVMLSTESILSISFTSSLARYGGDVAVGAMTVLTSINQLMTMPLSGVCQGGQPLISYNYGAKKYDRVKEAFFCQFFTCVGYTVVFWLVIQLAPNFFAGIFTSDAALVEYTAWAIKVFLALGFSVGFQISCQQAFMALGQAKISLVMALLRKVFLLIPLIFILPNFFADKAFAVFLAEPVSDIIAAAVTTFMFFRFFFRMLKEGKAARQ
nr:MATE family efflux transporter [Oscillospiraceae bacterium]